MFKMQHCVHSVMVLKDCILSVTEKHIAPSSGFNVTIYCTCELCHFGELIYYKGLSEYDKSSFMLLSLERSGPLNVHFQPLSHEGVK